MLDSWLAYISYTIKTNVPPMPIREAIFVLALLFLIVIVVCAFLGAIAGFAFSRSVNRLPFHSIYAKAVVSVTCLWLLLFLVKWSISRDEYLPQDFVSMALSALVFAYLFGRWSKSKTLLKSDMPL